MAKIYKVNGNIYTYNDFYWFLFELLYDYWADGVIIDDDYEYGRFIDKELVSVLDGIENYGEVASYGKFDLWVEEE